MIRARRQFGQHFLEPVWVDKVMAVIDPHVDDAFIEIGPGPGALTRPLSRRARSVTAFEIDRDLAAALTAESIPNLTVVEGDFLSRGVADAALQASDLRGPIRVAGNLPYNIASPILFKLVELHLAGVPLADATVMLQREVADRLVAPPGSKEYGVLSILIGHAADTATVLKLPAGAFRPPPRVLSSLVRLRFRAPDPEVLDRATFERVVQSVFTRRRKTLSNALLALDQWQPPQLRPAEALAAAGLDGSRRPETLSIGEFARLADAYVRGPRAVL
ncbi:MAG: 16S rRNA (adenine(1518)-N(6)/adenine(1519)-N(6))-dimethyltransferase RsmA [Vicinamibacterales bacterium]